MKKIFVFLLITASLFAVACTDKQATETSDETSEVSMISPETAKESLDENEDIILLDVRTESEYKTEHIEGAVLLPLDDISEKASEVIPDKEKTYYVYCRSGNRSAVGAQLLVDMGYENIYDLGGIIDWPYDTVKE